MWDPSTPQEVLWKNPLHNRGTEHTYKRKADSTSHAVLGKSFMIKTVFAHKENDDRSDFWKHDYPKLGEKRQVQMC